MLVAVPVPVTHARRVEQARPRARVMSMLVDGDSMGQIDIRGLGFAVVAVQRDPPVGSAPDRVGNRAREPRIGAPRPEHPPTIRHDIPRPSSEFTTYIEGELVQVSIPSNWRELPGFNAVTFAPEGAYGNAGMKSVFTHGLGMGLARTDQRDLRATTDDFIDAVVLAI